MNRVLRLLTVLLTLVAAATAVRADGAPADYRTPRFEVDVTRDIVYGVGLVNRDKGGPGTVELKLDAYRPRGNDAPDKPSVVLIHGGAFVGGDKQDLSGAAQELARRGFVCFSMGYRLMGLNPPEGRTAGVVDAQKAVRWVRYQAQEFGIDPGKVAALGHSAGAFVAIGLALIDTDLAAQNDEEIEVFGTSSYTSRVNAAVPVAGGFSHADAIDPMDPPMMIIHGTDDPVVPFSNAQAMAEACRQHGVPHVFTAIEGFGHDPWNATIDGKPFFEGIANFLADVLVEPPLPLRLAVEGNGTIAPERIRDAFPRGTVAGFRAEPSPGWAFSRWEGDAEGTEAAAALTMDAPKTVRAIFTPVANEGSYTLTVEESPHGVVTLDPPGGVYAAGTRVTLRAEPGLGRKFAYWTGDIRAATAETTVAMDQDRVITPGFVVDPDAEFFPFEVAVSGPGTARVAPDQDTYVIGSRVVLTAEPAAGAVFVGWEGDVDGNAPRETVEVTRALRATAVFEQRIVVEPSVLVFPGEGGQQSVRYAFEGGDAPGASGYYVDWGGPWFEVTAVDDGGALTVSATPNPTPYSRLLRMGFHCGNARALYVVGQQPGTRPEPGVADPGVAVYAGLPGEWGVLAWHQPAMPPDQLLLESNSDGSLAVGCYAGAAVGYLDDGRGEPLRIPDGGAYHIRAAWELPKNPKGFSGAQHPEPERPSYFYIGMDSGGPEFTKLRYGIEWKNMGNGDEWVLRGQRHVNEVSAAAANGGVTPRRIAVHVWKDPHGDKSASDEGRAAVFGQFRLDDGPWQDFTTEWGTPFVPLGALGYDAGDDVVTFKVRGLGSHRLEGIRVEGSDVPGVNKGPGDPHAGEESD